MRQLRGGHGVLPLLAPKVPEEGGEPWPARPVCAGLASSLACAPFEAFIGRSAQVAETLSGLAVEGIHDRDIEPASLTQTATVHWSATLDLSTFQVRIRITDVAGINGPRHYVPWEVINTSRVTTWSAQTCTRSLRRSGFSAPKRRSCTRPFLRCVDRRGEALGGGCKIGAQVKGVIGLVGWVTLRWPPGRRYITLRSRLCVGPKMDCLAFACQTMAGTELLDLVEEYNQRSSPHGGSRIRTRVGCTGEDAWTRVACSRTSGC